MQPTVIKHIIDQHAEEAAFLWLLRNNAITAPHYDLEDLYDLDQRVEAHIDGLRIAKDYGWKVCKENLNFDEAGELFVASVLALESQHTNKLETIYEKITANPELQQGFIAALNWVEPHYLTGKVSGLLASQSSFWQQLGIAACAVQRVDPAEHLLQAIQSRKQSDHNNELCYRALKAAGELGRVDLINELLNTLSSNDPALRFWAAWAALLCGDRQQAVNYLKQEISKGHKNKHFTANDALIVFHVLATDDSRELLRLLKEQKKNRLLIQAVGLTGESHYIPWLIEQMGIAAWARVAGESFTLITGVDLAYDDLETDMPKKFATGPSEDPNDEDIALDEDEDLPWPDQERISQWWSIHNVNYQPTTRYFMGNPSTKANSESILKIGKQRQRYIAAIELALIEPHSVLFETCAVARKQKQALGLQ